MRPRRLVILLISLSLIGAACRDGVATDDDTTTTDSGTEATVAEGSITNCEAPGLDAATTGNVELGTFHFAYLPDYVVVSEEQAELAENAMVAAEIEFSEATIDQVLETDEERPTDPSVIAARECLEKVLQVFGVTTDAREVSLKIRVNNPGLLMAPVQAMGEAGHSGYKAPTEPEPLDRSHIELFNEPGDADPDAHLAAVVDSGIYPETPGLMDNVDYAPGLDLEPAGGDGHSHGTFVSGIIRQLAQKHRITFARAPVRPLGEFRWSHSDDPGDIELPDLTTELDVAEAILRLVHRHQHEPDRVKSLNLSLGAYSPKPDEDLWMLTTSLALDLWAQTFHDSTVFAAGGNDDQVDPLLPLWPGALDALTSVGAVNDPSEDTPVEIVWDDNGNELIWTDIPGQAPRVWIDALAPGSMLVNYTQPDVLAYWSGSSFATAVANGLSLRGDSPAAVPRAEVRGLSYWDGRGVATGTGP